MGHRAFSLFAFAVLLLNCMVENVFAQGQAPPPKPPRVLTFETKIGAGWNLDKYGWMGFVSFSSDGTMVASDGASSPDDVSGDLRVWTFPEGQLLKRAPGRPTAISGDFKYYATYHSVNEVDSGKPLISLPSKTFAVHAFSADGRYVVESPFSRDRREAHIRIIDLSSGKRVSAFGKHEADSLAFSPDGHTIAAGYWQTVVLWDLSTGERLSELQGFERYVNALSFSPDGKLLAVGNDIGKLQIWNLSTRSILYSIQIDGGDVSEPAFSPDGHLVTVGTYGTGTAWLIDLRTGKIIDSYRASDLGCGAVAFSPDGRFLITPSTGGLIKWPYDRGGTIRVLSVAAR